MPRVIQNKIGLDEFVQRVVWANFADDWITLGPMIDNRAGPRLYEIGSGYLTAALQSRSASVTAAEEDAALKYIIGVFDLAGPNATQGKLGDAYGLASNLPGDAGWRFHQAMGRCGAMLEERYRYDPDSYAPVIFRQMLVESLAGSRGPRRNHDLDVAATRLAELWESTTGKTATVSSYRRTDGYGPPRSKFGLFALALFKALDPGIPDSAVMTACRNAVRKSMLPG